MEEKLYVLIGVGVALEGYVYLGGKKRSDIAFINTDEAVRAYYIGLCRGLGLNPRVYGKRISIHNYQLAVKLRQEIYEQGLRKLPNGVVKYPVDALRWAFTLEGGVVLGSDIRNDEIVFRSTSPIILSQIADLLEQVLGERPGVRKGIVYLRRKGLIRKFAEIIGFLPGAKAVRGKHKGIEKNLLLKILLSRHFF
ncbi:hypothetical protein [Pyrobaculum aerophilum]|uniref:Homing endonuclease LAGLIDADG domain-containing protein n=1 Tax=Pyrobaculum aerophilum TaxID=13773 RepID=A0A371QUJ6_9CREN|nr:hypothetical protein [Pyrobaculum aerophilum]RFA93063.1 hypothetical protein CGL51_13550 [Pyrobaculum aerophilum]RFA94949.1 hypothetical protein CGL52_13715 [Pyrobaculum aerophilum]